MRIAVRVVLVGHQDVGDVRRTPFARAGRGRSVGRQGRADAPTVTTVLVGGFERGHHAIGERALGVQEGLHRIRYYFARPQNIALNRVVDLRARHASLDVLRHVAIREPGMSGAAPREVENAELSRLKRRVFRQHLDNARRVGALGELTVHEHLVGVGPVYAGLAGGHAFARHDHGLNAHQEGVVVVDAGGRGDDDTAGSRVDGNDRPGGVGRAREGDREREQGDRTPKGAAQVRYRHAANVRPEHPDSQERAAYRCASFTAQSYMPPYCAAAWSQELSSRIPRARSSAQLSRSRYTCSARPMASAKSCAAYG